MENLILVYLPDNPHPNSQKGKAAIQVLKDIEVLKGYLALGKSQGWVDNLNLLILFKEYDKIKDSYFNIATRGAILFFTINDFTNINNMY